MKKLIVTITFALLYSHIFSQVPGTTYPNGSTNTSPGNPGMPVQPYNGTNPAGVPNQNGTNNTTVPDPTRPNTTYPNSTNPVNPNTTPATPGSTYPVNPIVPNTTSPATPNTIPVTPNKINRLFQDPSRTPREPQMHGPVSTVDGSTGKHRSKHKTVNGHKFGKSHHRMKTAKKHSDSSKEKSREKNTVGVR